MIDSRNDITWLHISDFHFRLRDGYDRDVVLKAMLTSLPEITGRLSKPDLIFATGDIAFSGKAAEYAEATKFFDDLLLVLGLSKHELFVIPGNHDIDRQKGKGLARTLGGSEEADEYFNPSEPLLHIEQRQAGFEAWYNAYFQDIRSFSKNTTCTDVEVITVRGLDVEILPINTAAFCLDDQDHGKLFVGRRCVQKAVGGLSNTGESLRIALMHHPFDWLSPLESTNVKSEVRSHVDCILSGHLHETDADSVVGVSGSVLHLKAGASYQTRNWPNTAMICTLSASRLIVCPIRYEDSPREVWTVDTSIFPKDPDYRGYFTLPRRLERGVDVKEIGENSLTRSSPTNAILSSHAQTAKLEFEQDLFVAPSGSALYSEPRLMTRPQEYMTQTEGIAERVTINDLLSSDASYIIETKAEYGGSTLVARLFFEFSVLGKTCFRKDAREMPNYRKKLETEFPASARVENGDAILIVDQFDMDKDERLLKELNHTKWFSRIIAVTVNRGLQPSNFIEPSSLEVDLKYLYLWPVSRDDIRSMASQLFESADQVFVSGVVDKVYGDLLGLCIPLTPSNVIMYLRVLHREGEFHPLNRVDILDRYLHEILRRPSDAYSDTFNAKNKIDILGAFVFELYTHRTNSFDDREWHAFIQRFQKDTLSEFDGLGLLQELLDSRILIRSAGRIFLKYSFFFSYFLGRHIAHRPTLLTEFLNEQAYLRVDGVVDVITGLSAENTALLTALTDRMKELLEAFSLQYITSDFDPLSGALWPDDKEEEKLWNSVPSEMAAGPRKVKDIDIIKTSLFAEARTADQEVRYAEFIKLETALFALACLLTEALKNCNDVGGHLKLAAYECVLRSHHVAYQLGCIFAPVLAKRSFFRWGGVVFLDFDKVGENENSAEAVTAVITNVSHAVASQTAEQMGSHKLAAVFKAREQAEKEIDLLEVMNFGCLLAAKGQGWAEVLSKIIQRTDKNSYYLSSMLRILMNHLSIEIIQSKDREAVKKLVALIQAKRTFKKQLPGAKVVSKMLSHLEKISHFDTDPKVDVN